METGNQAAIREGVLRYLEGRWFDTTLIAVGGAQCNRPSQGGIGYGEMDNHYPSHGTNGQISRTEVGRGKRCLEKRFGGHRPQLTLIVVVPIFEEKGKNIYAQGEVVLSLNFIYFI